MRTDSLRRPSTARQFLTCQEGRLRGSSVQRVYVLTDGELHDNDECRPALVDFRPRKVEVHVYGFGTEFDAAALKRLVSDQLGGSVKPICNTQDVIGTFAHIAAVNQRLVASEGMLTVEFEPNVACGDAWAFRPQERHLGLIKNRRLVRELGGLESDRVYALLLEARLPVDSRPRTTVARVRLVWESGQTRAEFPVLIEARRVARAGPAGCEPVPRVEQAFTILDALRRQGEPAAQLAALQARRDLYLLERRGPELIAALDRQLDVLAGKASSSSVDEEQRLYLEADVDTWLPPATAGPKSDQGTGPPPAPPSPNSDQGTVPPPGQ